jgi:hypothetical protein
MLEYEQNIYLGRHEVKFPLKCKKEPYKLFFPIVNLRVCVKFHHLATSGKYYFIHRCIFRSNCRLRL